MMFKKGDVVEWVCDEYNNPIKEGTSFSILVSGKGDLSGDFAGVVVEAEDKSYHEVGTPMSCWDTKQFRLKKHVAVSGDTPNNAFPVLKDGMVIETRCRGFYLVCADKVIRHDGYNRLASYEKDGKHKGSNSNFDIVRVYSGEHLYNFDLYEYVSDYPQDLVWEEQKNARAIAEIEEQMVELQQQLNTLQEKLVTLREEK